MHIQKLIKQGTKKMAFTSKTFNKLIKNTMINNALTLSEFTHLPTEIKTPLKTGHDLKVQLFESLRVFKFVDLHIQDNKLKVVLNIENIQSYIFDPETKLLKDTEKYLLDLYRVNNKYMKIGRLIKKLVPHYSDKQVLDLVDKFTQKTIYMYYVNDKIDLYYRTMKQEKSLSSCMAYKPSSYGRKHKDQDRFIHPTEAYNNSSNLRLCVFTYQPLHKIDLSKNKKLPFFARAICKVDRGLEIDTIYGDQLIKNSMLANRSIYDRFSELQCGELQKIYCDSGDLVVPYIDGTNRVQVYDNYIKIDSCGDSEPQHGDGRLYSGDRCECCGDSFNHEESGIYVDNYGHVCDNCSDDFVWVDRYDQYYHQDDCVLVDGDTWECSDDDDRIFAQCWHSDAYYYMCDLVLNESDDHYYHVDCIGDQIGYCEYDSCYYDYDDTFICEHDGNTYHYNYLVTINEESVAKFNASEYIEANC